MNLKATVLTAVCMAYVGNSLALSIRRTVCLAALCSKNSFKGESGEIPAKVIRKRRRLSEAWSCFAKTQGLIPKPDCVRDQLLLPSSCRSWASIPFTQSLSSPGHTQLSSLVALTEGEDLSSLQAFLKPDKNRRQFHRRAESLCGTALSPKAWALTVSLSTLIFKKANRWMRSYLKTMLGTP